MTVLSLEEVKNKLRNQHVLLDSNVLIEAKNAPDAFEEIIKIFLEAGCKPVTVPFVEFEVFRNSFQLELRKAQEEYLALWNRLKLPLGDQQKLLDDALAIAQYYKSRSLGSPQLSDCFIAAFAKRHARDLVVMTRNHKDFPPPLFQREIIWTASMPRDLLAFGFYRFNSGVELDIPG